MGSKHCYYIIEKGTYYILTDENVDQEDQGWQQTNLVLISGEKIIFVVTFDLPINELKPKIGFESELALL